MRAFKPSIVTLFAFAFAIAGMLPVHADDTEIYLGSSLGVSSVLPNVVFIIDTSGSMGSTVTSTQVPYDSATTYSGSCPSGRIYYSTNGRVPSCSSSDYFVDTLNYCAASVTPLNSLGFYTADTVAYWSASSRRSSRSRWRSLSRVTLDGSNTTNYVECAADSGKDGGPAPYTSKLYAADGTNGPYSNTQSQEISWSSLGTVTLYSSNYINYYNAPGTTTTNTRIGIVQTAFDNLLDATNNINVAVMRYDASSSSRGGYFIVPMMPLNDTTRPIIKAAVNALTANGMTPLAETEYEAYLYFQGKPVYFGNSTQPATNANATTTVTYPDSTTQTYSVLDSSGSNYVSPIQYQCQKNFTVLFTDGDPTYDGDADSQINSLLSAKSLPTCSFAAGDDCLDNLAGYMNSNDCRSDLAGNQTVISYYIGGFDAQGNTLLQSAATEGGGKYYAANDAITVANAFNAILTQIKEVNTSFVAPAVAVNAFNRFTNLDQLYYGLFRPSTAPHWEGNLKRYRLLNGQIVDVNNNAAVDPLTGFFSSTSTSWWTPSAIAPDGDDVGKGGAASQITLSRKAYTYTSSTAPNNADLTTAGNALSETNSAITASMLGDSTLTSTDVSGILQWARGVDLFDINSNGQTNDARTEWGDVLHSEPAVVTYGGTSTSPDITAFVGDNEGYLHAVNAGDGSEYFAFMPQELLPNLPILYDDIPGITHPYGMDGNVTAWANDVNGDGVIYDAGGNLESGEGVYIYAGMRRGGRNYYALDVTDRSRPLLMWEIKGGTGDFAELGQSWSQPKRARIKFNGADTNVLIFAGGYDATSEDSAAIPGGDTMGRALFIVNAMTGQKLWEAGPSGSSVANTTYTDMNYSIPSTPTVLDLNGDGYADTIFVGDMGGQIWRFDLNNSNGGATNLVSSGGVIAKLSDGTEAGSHRFYYAPSVSLSSDGTYLNVAIGSGFRAHPTYQTNQDAFYDIHTTISPPSYGTPLTPSNLYNATSNVAASTTTDLGNLQGNGWYINLDSNGEKVLSPALTINNEVLFTTYTPVASTQSSCAPSQGIARGYDISIDNGAPIVNGVATLGASPTARYMTFTQTGIVPGPVAVITSPPSGSSPGTGDNCTVLAGTNFFKSCTFNQVLKKTYWLKQ